MDTRIMKLGLLLFVAVSALGGCASGARMVRVDARGGELETWGPVVPAQAHMRELLVEHCQGRFAVADPQAASGEERGDNARLTFSCLQPADQAQLAYPAAPEAAAQDSVAVVTPAVTPELGSAP